jgi:hypothetical protein
LGAGLFSVITDRAITHHCRQAMTPEEVLRGGPALDDEATDASALECAIADVEGSKVSVAVLRGVWGIGAVVVCGG